MQRALRLTTLARDQLNAVPEGTRKKKIQRTLGLLETNLRHPSLNTHKYDGLSGDNGEDVFDAYIENKTPTAWRIFWHYGPGQGELTILAITPHP